MARGGRRPGAGRHPTPLALHRLSGTFQADRHGVASAAVAVPLPSSSEGWVPEPADQAALSPLAQRWLTAVLNVYVLSELEGLQLLEALKVLSRCEVLEQMDGMGTAGALVRERKLFASLWAAMDWRRAEP